MQTNAALPRAIEQRSPSSNSQQLEVLSDALLESCGAIKRGGKIYTSVALDRKIRDEHRRSLVVNESEVSDDVIGYLVEKQLDELIDVGSLTLRQEIVFRLYMDGLSCSKIAAALKIKYPVAAFRLRNARRKIKTAYTQGKYAGWYEVYLSEIRRGAKR